MAKLPPTFIAVSGVTQTFTLRVTNNGTASSSGTVTVTDPFEAAPPGAFDSINAVTAPGWSCNLTPPAATPATLLCTRSDALAPGDAYPDITVTAHVAGLPNDHILNTATVAGGGDGDTTNNSSTSTGQTTTRADVQLLKTAEPTTALTGQQVRFTLRVRNGGPSTAANVQVTDADIGTNYSVDSVSSSQGGCTALPCALGTLDAGGEATVTVIATVTVTGAGVVSADNTATVTSATTDPDPSNDDSTATVDVPPTADMSVTKTASPDPLDTTAPASYTLTFHNAGPQDAAGATLTDQLPSGFTFTSATPSQGSCAPPGADGAIFCALGTVASGATGTVTVNGTLAGSAAGTFVSNSAHVSSDARDREILPTSDHKISPPW